MEAVFEKKGLVPEGEDDGDGRSRVNGHQGSREVKGNSEAVLHGVKEKNAALRLYSYRLSI